MSKITFSERNENYKILLTKEMSDIILFFKKEFNLEIYLIFGTLLGAIREKDFIAHDTDIDLGYLSKFTSKEEVNKEFDFICESLKNKNLLKRRRGYKHFDCISLNKKFYFDIWVSYINITKNFCLAPFKFSFQENDFLPFRVISFKNKNFYIPKNSEFVLNKLYKNWATPILTNFRKFNF